MYKEYFSKLRELLSLEYNCSPVDFLKDETIITLPELKEGRRRYSNDKYFFHMATTGANAVITADECLHGFLSRYIADKPGHFLFEFPNLLPINEELGKHGYRLTQTYHMFLPCAEVVPAKTSTVKWFFGDEIKQFYGDKHYSNAISTEYNPNRPDTIVVCAYDGNDIMGMAGCSEDAPHWQQVGIDVLPKYRSMGIGTYLVTLLKNKLIAMGENPFYGTSLSNYHSWNIALKSGFKPAWVEIGSQRV